MYIFSIRRKQGHYNDHALLIKNLFACDIVKDPLEQLKIMITANKTIIFLDGDYSHLFFTPIIMIRSLFGLKNIMLSVRSEFLLFSGWKYSVKRFVFRFLKNIPHIRLISIHKNNEDLKKFFTDFIYDPQYWDLKYLDMEQRRPPELNQFKTDKKIMVFLGPLADRKYRGKLLKYISNKSSLNFHFIFAGKMMKEDADIINTHKDCTAINRFITNEELFFLYQLSDLVYAFYKIDKGPSGIFGRAMQMGKNAVVKEGGYLDKNHSDYKGIISIKNLNDFDNVDFENLPENNKSPNFDEAETLKEIIYRK